jgi:phosphatidylglycerophosphate synthase
MKKVFPFRFRPKFWQEYRTALKPLPIEALPDLLLYRPIAYLLVKALQPLPITPNQVSTMAIVTGLTGAGLLASNLPGSLKAAGCFYLATILLDCSDGMLARLKKTGTPLGRIIDGSIDYLYGLALMVALGCYFAHNDNFFNLSAWLLALLNLVSMMLQSMAVDYQRSQYLLQVLGQRNSIKQDIALFTAEQARLQKEGGNHLARALVWLYLFYCRVQIHFESQHTTRYNPETYHRRNRYTLRVWLNIDQSTHYTILLLSLWFFDLRVFLWYNLVIGNALLLLMLVVQHCVNKTIPRITDV